MGKDSTPTSSGGKRPTRVKAGWLRIPVGIDRSATDYRRRKARDAAYVKWRDLLQLPTRLLSDPRVVGALQDIWEHAYGPPSEGRGIPDLVAAAKAAAASLGTNASDAVSGYIRGANEWAGREASKVTGAIDTALANGLIETLRNYLGSREARIGVPLLRALLLRYGTEDDESAVRARVVMALRAVAQADAARWSMLGKRRLSVRALEALSDDHLDEFVRGLKCDLHPQASVLTLLDGFAVKRLARGHRSTKRLVRSGS